MPTMDIRFLLYKSLSSCLPLTLAISFGCATNPSYYAAKGPVLPAKQFTEEEICEQLHIECSSQKIPSVVTKFLYTVNSHLPHYYFQARDLYEDRVIPALSQSDFSPYPFSPLLPFRLWGLTLSLQPIVEVSVLDAEDSGRTSATLFTSISPQGQAALIQHLEKRGKTIDDDKESLSKLIEAIHNTTSGSSSSQPGSSSASLPGNNHHKLRLLVNASLNSTSPADRLEKSYVFILIPDGLSIRNIDQVETEKPKVDFGKRTVGEELAATIEIPTQIAKGSISPKISRSLERMVSREFARRTQGMNPERNTLFLIQEGQEGIDLNGNVVANLSVDFPDAKIETTTVFSDEPREASTDKPTFHFKTDDYDFINMREVYGLVVWVIQARVVVSGGHTVLEDDDVILPYIERGLYPVSLWKNPEALLEFFVQYEKTTQGSCKTAALVFKRAGEDTVERVFFNSYKEARAFKDYLLGIAKQGDPKLPITLPNGMIFGFTVDELGNSSQSAINISWKDNANTPVDINKMDIFSLEPRDFPLDLKKHVWQDSECT